MFRFAPRLLCLTALAACSVEGGGSDPLKPQPEPEQLQASTLDPTRIHFTRTATALRVTGDPNTIGTPSNLVVAEVRAGGGPVTGIPVEADGSFAIELASTGPTTVQLTPVAGDAVGEGRTYDVDAAGNASQTRPSCLLGTSGFWQLGNVYGKTPPRLQESLKLINECGDAVTLQSVTLRAGNEFTVVPRTLPVVLPADGLLDLTVQFELGAGEPGTGPARYDFVEVVTSLGNAGFVVRATRTPPAGL